MPVSPPTYRPSFLPTKAERDAQYNARKRNKASTKFYHSQAWLSIRIIKLSESPDCELCLLGGVHTPATHVHHKLELGTHPELALDVENMQALCLSCHSRHHATQ